MAQKPKHPLYRFVDKFTTEERVRDDAGAELFVLEDEATDDVDEDGKKVQDADGKPVRSRKPKKDKAGNPIPVMRTIEHVVPDHWMHWIVDADGKYREVRKGDTFSLREDYLASLGPQVEPVAAAKPEPAPAPTPVP